MRLVGQWTCRNKLISLVMGGSLLGMQNFSCCGRMKECEYVSPCGKYPYILNPLQLTRALLRLI